MSRIRIDTGVKWNCIRYIFTSLFLFAIWLLFSAKLAFVWIVFGLFCSMIVALFTYRNFIGNDEAGMYSVLPRPLMLIPALLFLVFSMYVSSWRVFIGILTNSFNPGVVYIRTRISSDLGRTALANSITFTPGTVTLSLDEDHISVHWLFVSTRHSRAAGDEIKGRMEYFIKKVWI